VVAIVDAVEVSYGRALGLIWSKVCHCPVCHAMCSCSGPKAVQCGPSTGGVFLISKSLCLMQENRSYPSRNKMHHKELGPAFLLMCSGKPTDHSLRCESYYDVDHNSGGSHSIHFSGHYTVWNPNNFFKLPIIPFKISRWFSHGPGHDHGLPFSCSQPQYYPICCVAPPRPPSPITR
jgi:hypothetical protein